MFKVWPKLSLLGLSELFQSIYRHEYVCWTSEKFAVTLSGLGGPCTAGVLGKFLQLGARYGATLISLCSTLNRRDRVSGIIFNLPGLCSTGKSYD